MPYLGQSPSKGDENNFKILDDISSYTLTFDGSDASVVSAANDTITSLNHRFVQGQRVTYNNGTGGSDIAGLTDGTVYYIIKHDHHTIKLATSASNATNGTAVNITNVGGGSSHTINVAFDGINTKFKATHTNGQKAKITRSAQLVISVNGVIQQPHDTATPSTGFGFDLDGTIVLSQAPVAGDVYWAHVLTNNNVTFDISDNDVDNFTGNGSTVSFNLSKTPPDNRNVLVTIDGVVQYPNDPDGTVRAYTVVENVLTFVTAPDANVQIQVRHIGFAGSTSGSGGVTSFYGRTGAVVLKNTDNIVANNAEFAGNLTVQGTMTTLDTKVTEVDQLEVAANNTTVGVAITQSGTGDILNLYDGSTEVFSVADGGLVEVKARAADTKRVVLAGSPTNTTFQLAAYDGATGTGAGTTQAKFGLFYNTDENAVLKFERGSGAPDGALTIHTNNTEQLRFSSNGDIKAGWGDKFIGMYHSADYYMGATFEAAGGTNRALFIDNRAGNGRGDIIFRTGVNQAPVERLTIKGTGNIGIGTDNPGQILDIFNDSPVIRLNDSDSTAGANSYFQVANLNGNTYVYSRANSNNGSYLIGGHGGGTFDEFVRITSGGEVGINTTVVPYGNFAVDHGQYGLTRISEYSHLLLQNKNSSTTQFWTLAPRDNGRFGIGRGTPASAGQITDEKFTIKSDGKIGIGTEIPAEKLSVEDSSPAILINATSATGESKLQFGRLGNTNVGEIKYEHSNNAFTFRTNDGADRLRIESNGNVLVGTTDSTIYNNGDSASEGIVLRGGDVIDIARKGDLQLTLNRQTNDGPHIAFYRSGGVRSYISTRDNAFCIDVNSTNERFRIDSDGQIGIGNIVPDTWSTGKSITIGTAQATLWGVGDQVNLSGNAYFNSGWKAAATKAGASQIQQALGQIDLRVTGSISADAAITWVNGVRITNAGLLRFGPGAEANTEASITAAIFQNVTGTATILKLGNTNTPSSANNRAIEFCDGTGGTEGSSKYTYARIKAERAGGSNSGRLILSTKPNNSDGPQKAIEITPDGDVLIGNGGVTTQEGDGRLIVYANTRLHPAIKADCIDGGINRANGFTMLADNYGADESISNIGLSYSGAGLVLSRGVKVSNAADNVYLSSTDTAAQKPTAFKLDSGGNFTFLNTDTSATTATDSAVTLTERLRIDSSGFIKQTFSSNNSTVAEGLFINNKDNSTGINASLIFSCDSGERKKASISYIDTGAYGTGDMVFSLDNDADSGELHVTNHERMRITKDGQVLIGHTATDDRDGYNSSLQVTGTSGDDTSISIGRWSNNQSSPALVFSKSRATTIGSHSVLTGNEYLGAIQFQGDDGTNYHVGASIQARVETEGAGNDDMPTRLFFNTNRDEANIANRMIIHGRGNDYGVKYGGRVDILGYEGQNITGGSKTNVLNEQFLVCPSAADGYADSHTITFGQTKGNWESGTSSAYDTSYGLMWFYGGQYNSTRSLRAGIHYDHKGQERFKFWSSYGDIIFKTRSTSQGDYTAEECDQEPLRITDTNRVGINRGGTASVDETLDVDGGARFRSYVYIGDGFYIKSNAFGGNTNTDTGISINQGGRGGCALLLVSRNYNNGTGTSAGIYRIKWYYDGNNAPATHHMSGDNFISFGVSGSNTLTINGGGGNQMYGIVHIG